MVKNVVFIEKENKPLFEVELLMEYMIDDIYNNIIVHYKKNQINDIILIDKRLDMWRNRLIGCNYLQNENIEIVESARSDRAPELADAPHLAPR